MLDVKLNASSDDSFLSEDRNIAIAVNNVHVVDESSRISSTKDQADLVDVALDNVREVIGPVSNLFYELIGEDGQELDVLVTNHLLCLLALSCSIEEGLTVNAIRPVLELYVTKDIADLVVSVLPHERYNLSIVVRKGVSENGPSIAAPQIISSGVATEIRHCHVDGILSADRNRANDSLNCGSDTISECA